ncbi:MAG: tetratricopeptide repeat protein [Bacteriovoracaceae bacterium]
MKSLLVILFFLTPYVLFAQDDISYWKQEYKRSPNNPEVLYELGSSYFVDQNFKQAAKYYQKLMKKKSSLRNLGAYYLALSYIEMEMPEKAYKIFRYLRKKRLSPSLKKNVKLYLNHFESLEEEEKESFLSRFSADIEAKYGSHSNPSYKTSDSEEGDTSLNSSGSIAFSIHETESFYSEASFSMSATEYSEQTSSNSYNKELGVSFQKYFKNFEISLSPYLSIDEDEDQETYRRKGANFNFSYREKDRVEINLYNTTTEDEDLDPYAGKTYEISYTRFEPMKNRKNIMHFTTVQFSQNNLNDTEYYFNSNEGIDLSYGVYYYPKKGSVSGSLDFSYKAYVLDETLGKGRYDKAWSGTLNYDYPITKWISFLAELSYSINDSNLKDVEDYDPTYTVSTYSVGLIASF